MRNAFLYVISKLTSLWRTFRRTWRRIKYGCKRNRLGYFSKCRNCAHLAKCRKFRRIQHEQFLFEQERYEHEKRKYFNKEDSL